MNVFFRVNNEYFGVCHLWREDPKNSDLTVEQKNEIPGIVIINTGSGTLDMLARHGFKKGDSVELGFDDRWEATSVRKPGDEAYIWKKESSVPIVCPPKNYDAPRLEGGKAKHTVVMIDLRLEIDVTSIFLGLRRAVLAYLDWDRALHTGREVCIPCRSYGWQNVSGRIIQILQFTNGRIMVLKPTYGSLLQNWPTFWIWFPTRGQAGVLNTITEQHHKFAALSAALRGTTISVGQAIDNGWL